MGEYTEVALKLTAVMFLVLLNGFFVATEFALVAVRRTRVQELAEEGSRGAKAVLRAQDNPAVFVSSTQVGITMASLGLGALGEPAVATLIAPLTESLGFSDSATHLISFIIAFMFITYMHVVLGEIAPKSLALQRSERVAMWCAGPILLFHQVLRPLIWIFTSSADLVLRLFRVPPAPGTHLIHSEEELKMLISQSTAGGVLQETERMMLDNAMGFADTTVEEVMVPRPDVIAFSIDASPAELLHQIVEQPYTRYPVYRENTDHIVGILHIRDLFNAVEKNGKDQVHIASLLRNPLRVPESKLLDGLLADFRRSKSHMALVLDEYGALAGIVTLEDLIEEIVGEIDDEHDVPDRHLEKISEHHLRVAGKYPLDELNERFHLDLPEDDYHTIGGFVFGLLGQQPHEGDVVRHGKVRMEVTETDGPRIVHVDIMIKAAASEADADPGGDTASDEDAALESNTAS